MSETFSRDYPYIWEAIKHYLNQMFFISKEFYHSPLWSQVINLNVLNNKDILRVSREKFVINNLLIK